MSGASPPVAMFDSGVGGLTVLHECLVSLPQEDFLYLGDTEWFPYGTRDPERLRARIARWLNAQGEAPTPLLAWGQGTHGLMKPQPSPEPDASHAGEL